MMPAPPPTPRSRSFLAAFGPGLLFAGTAIGVSHLVQATRAGATAGFALLFAVVLANALKYPAFLFGPRYAAATGTSLLEGYRRQGRWALILYGVLTLATMFTVQAAVLLTTAGLLGALIDLPPIPLALALTALAVGVLALGRFPGLDRLNKVLVALLTVSTLIATALALPRIDWSGPWLPDPATFTTASVVFLVGLVGWMPSGVDVAVWHSLWSLARRQSTGHAPTAREAKLDFDIGYLGTALLAVCFLLLGAAVMHGPGESFPAAPAAFAAKVVDLYAQTLGAWSRPLMGLAAFAVMLTTLITVVDGFPRALATLQARLRGPETPGVVHADEPGARRTYWVALAAIALVAVLIIAAFRGALTPLVEVATALSFLTAPVLCWLNHRAITGPEIVGEHRPGRGLLALSWVGIVFNGAFAILYLVVIA